MKAFEFNKWYSEAISLVEGLGSFYVHLPSNGRWKPVLDALLQKGNGCFVYNLDPQARYLPNLGGISEMDRNKVKMDLTKDCISGFESFWTSKTGERGTVVITASQENIDFHSLMTGCLDPSLLSNPGSIHDKSAIEFCRRRAKKFDEVVFSLPPRHGIEVLFIFANSKMIRTLFKTAAQTCDVSSEFIECYRERRE